MNLACMQMDPNPPRASALEHLPWLCPTIHPQSKIGIKMSRRIAPSDVGDERAQNLRVTQEVLRPGMRASHKFAKRCNRLNAGRGLKAAFCSYTPAKQLIIPRARKPHRAR